ncbi:hypothetical protein [Actinophytocola sp. NPDC049390]
MTGPWAVTRMCPHPLLPKGDRHMSENMNNIFGRTRDVHVSGINPPAAG